MNIDASFKKTYKINLYGDFYELPNLSEVFVDPSRTRSKQDYPYSYDPYWIWKKGDVNEQGVNAVYHDRMQQWDYEKYKNAFKSVTNDNHNGYGIGSFTQKQASKFMSFYQGYDCEVIAIAEGCNQSNGYPYWVFWYKKREG